uniref:ATP-dependent Clp protease proteolytic subunit n=2 Tax=Chaetophoropsis TaxID=2505929 RepID=A0A6H1U7G4_9CHLO|nr:proteolytic subunit 2 of clp protease [Chaetophoropsis cf. attenuata FACHB-2291]QJE70486.1 proteolytic subunit 2 of clp protease [Chaetophoropsis pisiformis]
MPIGVPKVLYYWDDELPLQWVDLYHLIFRRRLVFVMSELDQDLCNQIAGMMVYIHFEDKRDELETQGSSARDLFSSNLDSNPENTKSYKLTYQDLMDYDNIWDLEAGMEKDYYLDLYNSDNFGDDIWTNDYNENSLAFNKQSLNNATESILPSRECQSLNLSNAMNFGLDLDALNLPLKNSEQIGNSVALKQYSNFFNIWLPLLPVLQKYGNKTKNKEFLSDTLKSLLLATKVPNQELGVNMERNSIYQALKYYLDRYQRSHNQNEFVQQLLRISVKETLKKAYYQDVKDQKIHDLSTYSKVMEDIYMPRNIRQKKSESEDLLFMETQERLQEQSRVFVFINSTGGSVSSGITIYDALQFVKTGAVTVCLGMAFSASSMVLAGGNIGHRYVAEGAHVMIHQPEGGITGQASDVLLDAYEILRIRRQVATIYSLCSKRALSEVLKDLDRDNFMTPQEAVDYGLADEIVTRYNSECILDEFEKDWFAHDAKQIEGISKKIKQQDEDDEPSTAGSESLF